jgi:hypothetical protein
MKEAAGLIDYRLMYLNLPDAIGLTPKTALMLQFSKIYQAEVIMKIIKRALSEC